MNERLPPAPLVPIAALVLVALVLLGALSACAGRYYPDPAFPPPSTTTPAHDPFTILWLGDTLLADAAQPHLDAHGYDWPFAQLPPLHADFVVANAEGPIIKRTEPFDPGQRWHYNAQPQAAAALAAAGVDAAGLANNHALDRGPEGLLDTLQQLAAAGVQPFGAGRNEAEALRPLLIETPYGTVGVVALGGFYGSGRLAGAHHAGTARHVRDTVEQAATLARQAGARWLVGFVHWGNNYTHVNTEQRRIAQHFTAAGFDLVIGHGAHVVQQAEFVDGVPVLYSLGNFVFGTPGRFNDDFPGFGLLATAHLGPDGFHTLTLRCLRTDNDLVRFQPRPCTHAQSLDVLAGVHPAIQLESDRVDGDLGVLRWGPVALDQSLARDQED